MTKLTPEEDFALCSPEQIKADLEEGKKIAATCSACGEGGWIHGKGCAYCGHHWYAERVCCQTPQIEEVDAEPPYDVCVSCGTRFD